jgi:putative oxidoreductase
VVSGRPTASGGCGPAHAERIALALLRVSLALFLLLWGLEKLVLPAATVRIWGTFYGIQIGRAIVPVIGLLEAVLALAIGLGLWRRVSYGLGTLVHGISVLSTWRQLIDPWGLFFGGPPNHLFLAGVPVLAGFTALFLLRERDTWTLDAWRAGRSTT